MANHDDIEDVLFAIHSKLALIDGKTTLNVRANRDPMLAALRELIDSKPLIGQIYLVVDGKRTQTEIGEALGKHGVDAGPMAISRAFAKAAEYGIVELRGDAGRGNVYRRDPNMEHILHLSKNISDWLNASGSKVPMGPKRRPRKKVSK